MPHKDPAKRTAYNVNRQREWRKNNREEYLAKRREWKKRYSATPKGKLQRRKESLKFLYGITLTEYDQLFEAQGKKCAVCGNTSPGGKHKHFSVDHDHETGRIRGLLCNDCNRGIGLLGDAIENMERALVYLKNNLEANV